MNECELEIKKLLNIYLAINSSKSLDNMLEVICQQVTKYLHADRSSIYLYDENNNILYTKVAEGLQNKIITLKLGQGIAGHVASTRKNFISNDVYKCELFDPHFDNLYNYKTERILCMPLTNLQNELIGVIQVLNKSEEFHEDDINKMNKLTTISAVALDEVKLFEKVKKMKDFNERIIDSIQMPLVVINSNNEITTYNKKFEKKFLSDFNDNVNEKNKFDGFDFIKKMKPYLEKTKLENNVDLKEYEININDKKHYFNIHIKQLDGAENHLILLMDDITELVELKKSEYLSIIGKFTSSIIHDIKSPMSLINGYVQVIQNLTDNKQIQKYTNIILDEINRLINMTREVLDFANNDIKLDRMTVNIQGFFDIIKYKLKNILDSQNIQLDIDIKDNSYVKLDIEKFQRVIFNLVENSKYVLRENGVVNIKTISDNAGYLKIIISDNGPGIPDEIKNKIFEPFVSYNKQNGTGLGISIAKKIVEEHDGKIEFNSAKKQGAEFIISLPEIEKPEK